MTDVQLYFAIGLPTFAFLINIALGVIQTNALQAGISSVETATNARFASFDARFNSLESTMNARFGSLESRFETLIGKVVEIDNRLTRVEERLLHS